MRGVRKSAIVLVPTLLACLGFVPTQKVHDDGLWPLTVIIRSESRDRIVAASAEAVDDEATGMTRLTDLAPPEGIYSRVEDSYSGEPFTVPVPTSETTRKSLLWSQRHFFQFTGLVVIVQYEDGRREGRVLKIPDLRQTRELTVTLP